MIACNLACPTNRPPVSFLLRLGRWVNIIYVEPHFPDFWVARHFHPNVSIRERERGGLVWAVNGIIYPSILEHWAGTRPGVMTSFDRDLSFVPAAPHTLLPSPSPDSMQLTILLMMLI